MYSSANHESCFALKIVIINGIHFNIFGGGLISRGERRADQMYSFVHTQIGLFLGARQHK